MEGQQKGIVALIRSGITGEKLTLAQDFDLEQAYPELVRHQIQPLGYLGAVQCGAAKELPAMKKLFQTYYRCLLYSEGQLKMIQRICSAFDHAEIDYMPLKGCNLKYLYPKPELRLMGDADILIRPEQYDRIRPIMLELGFSEQGESDHELIWHTEQLHLELHKRLIPSYNEDYHRYFEDGWKLAKVRSGTRYEMSKEDEFIYIFTHFAKHYRDGGIGCRHVADLWVYRRAYPELDGEYITAELEKLQLLEFYRNMQQLLRVWFEGAAEDEKTRFITDFIFGSGSWGDAETHVVSAGAKSAKAMGSAELGQVRRALIMAFPNLTAMKQRYPVLKKMPFLLPLFWPVRWVTAVLFRRENIRRQGRDLAMVTPEKIQTYQQALSYVGLEFRFKE